MKEKEAQAINTIGDYLGVRDVAELTSAELEKHYGFPQADVMVLFGGSILCGGDLLAQAMKNKVAKTYIIVGGAGHTTETFREKMHKACPDDETANKTEAEIFNTYLQVHHHLSADFLETKSTNCGNNITYLLDLLKEHSIDCHNMIITQDATMQRRMAALLNREDQAINVINYAAYHVYVKVQDDNFVYEETPWGMWQMERYVSLLLGDVARLRDDENGYGPKGKNFLDHIDVPQDVLRAFDDLAELYPHLVRKANPLYASKETK